MLAAEQGIRPERVYVVTPDTEPPVHTYRVDDYAAYFRLIRRQMLRVVALDFGQVATDNYPEPVDHCEICHWIAECKEKRRADDHLSLVAGISRVQLRVPEGQSVTTLTSLASMQIPLPFTQAFGSAPT